MNEYELAMFIIALISLLIAMDGWIESKKHK